MNPCFGQADGEPVIVRAVDLGVGDVAGPAFQAVLADDDRAFFALLDPLGQEQDAVGDHVGKDVHDDLVAGELGLVVDSPAADVRGQGGHVEPADDLAGERRRGRARPSCVNASSEETSSFFMNSRRTSALSTRSCWLWRSSSWSCRAWRAAVASAGRRGPSRLRSLERLQV